jgi:aminomethyltransferase
MKRTPLYPCHQEANARFVDFGGWEMPVQYSGIKKEHHAVRADLGLFDVSHMGEVEVRGSTAVDAVNALITNDLQKISDGQACYTAMCNHQGGIVDDLVVYRWNQERVLICVNAANRAKDFKWIQDHIQGDITVEDHSDHYAQIALQGPRAEQFLADFTDHDVSQIKRYWFSSGPIAGVECIISRTGYTGEDGFELYMPATEACTIWNAFMKHKKAPTPAGLGARDTLRLEHKYALYGNDINDETTPLEAGLSWITKLNKDYFIGQNALKAQKTAGIPRFLVAFRMLGKSIARHDYPILNDADEVIGIVTSGTRSPSFDCNIGMGYVPYDMRKQGTRFFVQVRKQKAEAEVIRLPIKI